MMLLNVHQLACALTLISMMVLLIQSHFGWRLTELPSAGVGLASILLQH